MSKVQKQQQARQYQQADARDASAFLLYMLGRAKLLPQKRALILSGLAGFNRNVTGG